MRKLFLLVFVILSSTLLLAQLNQTAVYNTAQNPPDPDKPYIDDQGIRSVWYAGDLDQDGKDEFLLTDYSYTRVHVLEYTAPGTLEIVWSSPKVEGAGGSTPRWVRSGDLDGDGSKEIIFPTLAANNLQVWEWDGSDNSFGTEAAMIFTPDQFVSDGATNFRFNREVASVYDYDGDGLDELIFHTTGTANDVYVIGVSGDFPGFAGWVIEGGNPTTQPYNGSDFARGSYWHSVPADINGDGKIEIVNHTWNFWGFWSIEPTGPDAYDYPTADMQNKYYEFTADDYVSYMGIQPVDVDGDQKDELAGIFYNSAGSNVYDVGLVALNKDDDALNSWDSTKFSIIGVDVWTAAGYETGSFWGIGAADFNGNGREEILLGGTDGYAIMALEYKGTGSILDTANYDKYVLYEGWDETIFERYDIRDSLGVVDTLYTEAPFISKMYAPVDVDKDGNLEVVAAFQSVYDSSRFAYSHYESGAFVEDSIVKRFNPDQITIRLLEAGVTGVEAEELTIVTPDDYTLEQNYPNPFNPATTIRFSLPVDKKISLKIFDMLGKEVVTLIDNKEFKKGSYEVEWDAAGYASGMYVYTLTYGNYSKSAKMTLLK